MRTSLLALLALSACSVSRTTPPEASGIPASLSEVEPGTRLVRGSELFAAHCAVCHGTRGRGDGPAAPFLFPPARRFDEARFRLVSSENGAPFDRDLVATLRRGMPGSAMPAWGWLPEEDLWALAAHVRRLAREELETDLRLDASRVDDPLLLAEAGTIARARTTPDRPLAEHVRVASDAGSRAHGRALFQQHCAQCHAADGTGEVEPRPDEDGSLNWARDLTAGFLKGGAAPRELAHRIRAGMPGTSMPPSELTPDDEAALLGFLEELVPPGSSERLVHRRASLRAQRVPLAPLEPRDPAWDGADEIEVVLAPLWWHEEAVLGASLAAVHDGSTLALRLAWPDETGTLRLFSDTLASDGAALQLSSAPHPPLFGMGAPGTPTQLWHWKALRTEDAAGLLDLVLPTPHAGPPPAPGEVRSDVPLYRRFLARLEPSERVDHVVAEGIAALPGATRVAGEVEARAEWQAGRWSVVFRRVLVGDETPLLVPGRTLQVACAVWNGAAGDAGARKSISIWQELVLDE
ncbi:MAG TPA: c-type cytochrome [Planctomycetota bacterium]